MIDTALLSVMRLIHLQSKGTVRPAYHRIAFVMQFRDYVKNMLSYFPEYLTDSFELYGVRKVGS